MEFVALVKIIQIIASVLIVLLVLIQTKTGGITSNIGNSISMYRSRRGLEKMILFMTIFFSLILVINSLILLTVT